MEVKLLQAGEVTQAASNVLTQPAGGGQMVESNIMRPFRGACTAAVPPYVMELKSRSWIRPARLHAARVATCCLHSAV